ncbi:MAG: Rnase Y domain-containing protein, partial [Pirellulales bacterium]|nr:Rnase Y domain-containing protein [Pirellulales bacterium]
MASLLFSHTPLNHSLLLAVDEGVTSDLGQLITITVAALLGMGVIKLLDYLRKRDSEKEARQIIERADVEAASRRKEAEVEAKELGLQEKSRLERENNEIRNQLHERERHLDKTEDSLNQRNEQLLKQEKMVENNQRRAAEKLDDVNRRQKELDDLLNLERQTMHKLSGLTSEEAETRLLERLEQELIKQQGALILRYEKEAAEKCDAKAKEMLITSLQRFAAAHTAESTTSTVDIPNDEMKGRIIGREGRNIRALEKATGVDVIIDDTPGVV